MVKNIFKISVFLLVCLVSFFTYNNSAIALGSLGISNVTVSSDQKTLTVTGRAYGGINIDGQICPNSPRPRRANPEFPGSLSDFNYRVNNGAGGSGPFVPNNIALGQTATCYSINPASETTYDFSFAVNISSLPSGTHTIEACANSESSPVCDQANFTKDLKPKFGLSKYQSVLICNSSNLSSCTQDSLWVLNNQANLSAPVMNWTNGRGAESAYLLNLRKSFGNLFSILVKQALAATCSGSGFLTSRMDSLCGGFGLASSGQSAGYLVVISPTQVTKMNYDYRGFIDGACAPTLNSCETGSQEGTLDVIYRVQGPSVEIRANNQTGTISINPGQAVNLIWTSDNTNATNPVNSCSFGCTTPTGSQTVFPLVTTTYTIKVKGISDVATEANGNYATSSVTVVVGGVIPTTTVTPTGSTTPTPTPPPGTLSCLPGSQIVNPNQQATLTSSFTTGINTWSAPNGSPVSGTGNSFNVSYSSTGQKTITLNNSSVPGSSAQCIVQVIDANPPPPIGNVRCEPNSQTINTGQAASLTGEGSASGFYSWLSGGGAPVNGFTNGSVPFQPVYSAVGNYLVTVWDAYNPLDVSTCTVTVVNAPNSPPSVPTISVIEPNYCTTGPAATVNWTYLDINGDSQSAYQVQIDDQGSFNSPEVDSGKVLSSGTSYFSGTGYLQFNTTYRARVRVWDSKDSVSAWKVSSSWNTPKHAYPSANFSWSPASPRINQPIQFSDATTFYDTSGIGQRAWLWNFADGVSSTAQNPLHTYSSAGTYNVTETVTDKDGFSCSVSHPVPVGRNIPTWKEVSPK